VGYYEVVVSNISSGHSASCNIAYIFFQQIRGLSELSWEIKICHTFRETNICVDVLANDGNWSLF
jgi:hypothetical protein